MSRVALKYLVSNGLAGSLIGTGGSAIKELIEVSDARVIVSSITDVYPGTSERIILISGLLDAVDVAQGLVWKMIAANTRSNGDKSVAWSPRAANEAQDDNDDISITGKISIPASAGGLILGRGGESLRTMASECEVTVQMTGKDDAIFTQERILTINGLAVCCENFVSLVLAKLAGEAETAQYVNRGVTYSSHNPYMTAPQRSPRTTGGRPARGAQEEPIPEDTTTTEIHITVPDSLVGNILGRQGNTMREIMSLSGAKIRVSPRGEAGTNTNRTVTITGSPMHAQTAHHLVTQKLQQASTAPPRTRRPKE